MFERTASANWCLDIAQASAVWSNVGVCQVQRLRLRAVETFKIPDVPTYTEHQQLFALFYQSCPFKSELVIMALSKEMNAFNIDAILASTADFTTQEFVLMQQFISHDRGLKAYEDRF